jgi:two-component system, sensor histidine kinase
VKLPAALPKPVGSLRSQILIAALLPTLLSGLGLAGYFSRHVSGSSQWWLQAGLLVGAGLAMSGILAWRLSRQLAVAVDELRQAVSRLEQGDLAVRALPLNESEFGALATGINDMASALQAYQAERQVRGNDDATELAARIDSVERANAAKSRFFAAASHDLRQPMHALSLFVSALKARNRQPEVADLVGHIEDATASMEELFNALLDISRLDAGVIEARPVHFPLQHLLDELDSQFAPLAAEKGLRFSVRPCSSHLCSDPLLLKRILINLISNAIRHSDDGGVLVGCRKSGDSLKIGVWDTGRGIPADQLPSIFQEFVQLHNPERDRRKGLGLGLAIVNRLVLLLGHRLEMRSQLARGSCFSIEVPAGNPDLALPPSVPSATGVLPEDSLVVLVDDDHAILHGMAELFDSWNIDLVAAPNAEDVLHWLAGLARVPDLIVADYRLPGDNDGLGVIAQLRRQFGRDIPAIVITGDTAPDTIQRIKQAGFPVLNKPLHPAKLRALLTHLLQQNPTQPVG